MYDVLMESVVRAQVVPFDPTAWTIYGPLGVICGWLFWKNSRLEDRIDKLITDHKVEIAAKDVVILQLQNSRLEDQKTLIPLTHSLTTVLEMQAESRK